jgi:Protein NO VEIN, C-terminal
VLEEISAKLGRENEPLSEAEDRSVFWVCWRLLERALEDGRVREDELAALSRQKVIPGPHDLLVVPTDVLFEDWPGIAGEFPPLVAQHIIQRPSGASVAMQAAGVATLSERLAIHIVELEGVTESPSATERITERRAQIGRIIEHELGSSARETASAVLLELRVMFAETLAIQYELTFRGALYHASAKPVPAHCDEPSRTLYVIPDTGTLPWAPVARELGRALAPSPASVSSLASALHGVLNASTSEAATSLLDELGFPRLQEPETGSPPPAVAEELGQEDTHEPGAPEPAEREGPAPTRSPAGLPGQTGDRSSGTGTDGYGGSSQYEGQRPIGVSEEGRPGRTSGRLRTYVEPDGRDGDIEAGHEPEDHRREVDHAGISHVERFEREAGRDPEVMPPNNPGYDVVSRGAVGEIVRYIEVKSLGGRWALQGAGLSRRQFETARELGSRFWMYVVEHALSDDAKVWAIQNPAVRANQFLFDEGWRALAAAGGEDRGDDLELLSPAAQVFVEELLAQGADPPIIGFEVGPTDRQEVWQLEAAWPLRRIAILVDRNPQRDSWLSERGWDARQVEDWTLEELLQALTDSPT